MSGHVRRSQLLEKRVLPLWAVRAQPRCFILALYDMCSRVERVLALRAEYRQRQLEESSAQAQPLEQFTQWFNDAQNAELYEPNAMTLATVGPNGQPRARIVLLKDFSAGRLVFFTNLESDKGKELLANPSAALCFHWAELGRQVRIEGQAVRVSDIEADAYFRTRPRESQLGAWASQQSRVIVDRVALEAAFADVAARYVEREVPRPSYWSGFGIVPSAYEFWQGRPGRLHDRLRYRLVGNDWVRERLSP